MTRKFLICGSRDWDNYAVMRFRMSNLSGKMTLIHGDDKGADRMAVDIWTRILKYASLAFPADWKRYPRSAGSIRNKKILDDNPEIELVIAFSNDLSISENTQDMIKKALRALIPVEIIREETYYHIESI